MNIENSNFSEERNVILQINKKNKKKFIFTVKRDLV